MRQYPECLNRRYQALDDLIKELDATGSEHSREVGSTELSPADPGVKLMCKFWNILKEDPDCNLQHVVQQRMELSARGSGFVKPQNISCYVCSQENQGSNDKLKTICCSSGSGPPTANASASHDHCIKSEGVPLSKVLCNLKEAASVDKKCSTKIAELKVIQKQVAEQVAILESREKEGTQMMKQADCMWTCMEETYKQKIAESIERQKQLMKQQKDVESHVSKWRKSKKELDLQMKQLEKCEKEIKEKLSLKGSDLKCMKSEIADIKKRIENNAKDIEVVKNSTGGKKRASAEKIAKLTEELKNIQENISSERKIKKQKEEDGQQYIKEAREDLQNICRILLQKKLENEDIKAETEAIIDEVELLKKTTDQCKDKCKNKRDSIADALSKVNGEIASFKARCTKCHQCVDTHDVRRFCTDCPKCLEERECLYNEGQCTEDPNNDCICMSVKKKFLDNVFENMYSVLDRQSKTASGKALAEQILACLQNSRNGKLTEPIRKALQEFVLVTVKKNLNLTIIGGAVKTRCEMDPDTYKQLMNCLTKLTVSPPEKKDTGTAAKKDSCKRWGGTGECNCPSGPKYCVCTRKAPPHPSDPTPCPQLEEDKQDIGEAPTCPHHPSLPCGPDCANANVSNTVKDLVKSFNPPPCSGQSCTFTKNMRAAQCMLGQESLNNTLSKSKGYMNRTLRPEVSKYKGITSTPFVPDLDEKMSCTCGCGSEKPCSCYDDCKKCQKGDKSVKKIKETKKEKTSRNNHLKNGKDNKSKGSVLSKEVLDVGHSKNHNTEKYVEQNTEVLKDLNVIAEEVEQTTKTNVETNLKLSKDIDVPLFQAEVLTKAYQERGTEPFITMSKKNQNRVSLQHVVNDLTNEMVPKDLFKVAVPNEIGETDNEFTELTATRSGSIQMALDEKTIASIESKTRENPNLTIALKKTISGHFVVEFNNCNCNSTESRRVLVNRTDSGNIVMEVHKNLIGTIQPSILKIRGSKKVSPQISQKPSEFIGIEKKKRMHSCNNQNTDFVELQESSQFGYTSNNSTEQQDLIVSEIKEIKACHDIPKCRFKNHNNDVNQDRVQIKLVNDSTSTSTVDLKLKDKEKLRCLKKINTNTKTQKNEAKLNTDMGKRPFNNNDDSDLFVSLKDTFQKMIEENHRSIDITVVSENGVESDIKAKLIRTQSGQIAIDTKAIVHTGQIASLLKNYPITLSKRNSRYLLNFDENSKNANAVLKRSSSGATYVVLQKPVSELDENDVTTLEAKQKYFKVRVKGVEHSDPIPTTVMRLTCSGNYVFVFDKEFKNPYLQTIKETVGDDDECYVSLSKTQSDCYAIDFNAITENSNNALLVKSQSGNIKILVQGPAFEAISISPESNQRSSIVFQELFVKLPHSSREFHRVKLAKSKYLETKSFSDSRLYDKVRIQDQDSLLAMTSAALKRTVSGKYTVVLNKEFKPAFLKNLKSYISSSGQGFIPIVKTDQGDIIISLKRDHKGVYGSVKITPSGNIYVSVDENVIKNIENDKMNKKNELISERSSQSVRMIGTIMHPQHKEVTTTCHAQPDKCSCDASKCVCKELQSLDSSWAYTDEENNSKGVFDCNHVQVEEDITRYPYSILSKKRQVNEQCFYVIDTTAEHGRPSESSVEQDSTIAKRRNDTGKEPAREDNFGKGEQSYTNIYQKRDTSNLDYLESLPPQLPIFLRGFDF